jgi:hypothetical protein
VLARFCVTNEWELVRDLDYLAIAVEAYNNFKVSRTRKIPKLSKEYRWSRLPADKSVSFLEDEDKSFEEEFFCFSAWSDKY